jgi:hypothetical protein
MYSIIVSFANAGIVNAIIFLMEVKYFWPIVYIYYPIIIFGKENTRWIISRDYKFRENLHKGGHDLRRGVKDHALLRHCPNYLAFD